MKKIAVFPGSFDPFTNGHEEILVKSLKSFDEVIVLVMKNPSKSPVFSIEERINIIKRIAEKYRGVSVDTYEGLTINYAKKHDAQCLIRGLRAVSDFEYEFKLYAANKAIDSSVESVFFMAESNQSFVSSSLIVELYKNGVDISGFVSPVVIEVLKKKF